jgi:hypothetical protein
MLHLDVEAAAEAGQFADRAEQHILPAEQRSRSHTLCAVGGCEKAARLRPGA